MTRSLILSRAWGAPAYTSPGAVHTYELLGDRSMNAHTTVASIKVRPNLPLFSAPPPRFATTSINRADGSSTAFVGHQHRDLVLSLAIYAPTASDLDAAIGEVVLLCDPVANSVGIRLAYTADGGSGRFIEGAVISSQSIGIKYEGVRTATLTMVVRCSDPYWYAETATAIDVVIDQEIATVGNPPGVVSWPPAMGPSDFKYWGQTTITAAEIPAGALDVWPRFTCNYSGPPSTTTVVQFDVGYNGAIVWGVADPGIKQVRFGDRFEAATFHTDPKYRGKYSDLAGYAGGPSQGYETTLLAGTEPYLLKVSADPIIVMTDHDIATNELEISFNNRYLTPS